MNDDFNDKIPPEIRLTIKIEEMFQKKYENELCAAKIRFEKMKKLGMSAYSYHGDHLMRAVEVSMLTGNFDSLFDAYEIEKSRSPYYAQPESNENFDKELM